MRARGTFSNVTDAQSTICLTKAKFCFRLSQGQTPIDMDDSKVVITYTNPRCHTLVYDANTNTTTITPMAGDRTPCWRLARNSRWR